MYQMCFQCVGVIELVQVTMLSMFAIYCDHNLLGDDVFSRSYKTLKHSAVDSNDAVAKSIGPRINNLKSINISMEKPLSVGSYLQRG